MKTKHRNRYLRKVLKNLARDDPKTKEAVLAGFNIGDEDEKMAQLAMSLVTNKHVKILCLDNCGITSKGAHLLAYALGKNTSLNHVWLNHNKIGSSGADAIASALTTNRTLSTIGLSNNSIGNHGGKALLRALKQNYSITDVFVEGNRMSGRIEDEISRICYGEETDEDSDEIYESHFNCNHQSVIDDFDAGTVAGSVVSKTYVARTLVSIREVDESGHDSDDDSLSSSSLSDDEPLDMDFTCFYQKEKKSKFSKLKSVTRLMSRKKVKPGLQEVRLK
mmetsp:Transcript_24663/g.59472  ORF Transcript_24663/g.59472 Transcript_24663/m.59472 type:complete len:278 (-) Transcript_24663:114-947(-)